MKTGRKAEVDGPALLSQSAPAQRLLSSYADLTSVLRKIERGQKINVQEGITGGKEGEKAEVEEQLEQFVERVSKLNEQARSVQPAREKRTGLRSYRIHDDRKSSWNGTRGAYPDSTKSSMLEKVLDADLRLTSKSENALYGSLRLQRKRGRPSWKSAVKDNTGLQARLHRAQRRAREGKKLIAAAAQKHVAAQRTGIATMPRASRMEAAVQLVKETSGQSFQYTPSLSKHANEPKRSSLPPEETPAGMHFPQWGWQEPMKQQLIPHKVLKESEPPVVSMVFGAGIEGKRERAENSGGYETNTNLLSLLDSSVFFEVGSKGRNLCEY